MKTLPASVSAYRRTPDFDEKSIPAGLLRSHATKPGVWGRIRLAEGRLLYRILATEPGAQAEEVELSPGVDGVIEPELRHEVKPLGRVRFHVEFLREPAPGRC